MAYLHKATGYVYMRNNQDKVVYLHREIARTILDRDLLPGEVVHHIDEDRSNNDPSNLMVFKTHGDHVSFHKLNELDRELLRLDDGSYICRQKASVRCGVCGLMFVPSRKGTSRQQKYCSHSCAAKSKESINTWDEKVMLHKSVWDAPISQVSKSIGISDTGLLKRCKKYGVPVPGRGFWNKIKACKFEGQFCPLP